jgi:hypothetical protein
MWRHPVRHGVAQTADSPADGALHLEGRSSLSDQLDETLTSTLMPISASDIPTKLPATGTA